MEQDIIALLDEFEQTNNRFESADESHKAVADEFLRSSSLRATAREQRRTAITNLQKVLKRLKGQL